MEAPAMVSLVDLHATPREPDLALASSGAAEFKRPADVRVLYNGWGPSEGATPRSTGVTPRSAPAHVGGSGGGPFAGSAFHVRGGGGYEGTARLKEALRGMRGEVLALEDAIPWNSVRRTWRNKRTTWRRQVKTTEAPPDLAMRLKELRGALLTEDNSLPGCGNSWRLQLEACMQGKGSAGLLAAVWEEMRGSIRSWLEGRAQPSPMSQAQLQAGAVRAVRAMQGIALGVAAAGRGGGGGYGGAAEGPEAALLQVPLEAIVGGDAQGLQAVRQAIELERRIMAARLAAQQQQQQQDAAGAAAGGGSSEGAPQPPMVSYFSSICSAWGDSDFDSGAESGRELGDEDTDMDSDYEP